MAERPAPNAVEMRLTQSVESISADDRAMSAVELATTLFDLHQEYPGRNEALRVLAGLGEQGVKRSGREWVRLVRDSLDPSKLSTLAPDELVLHGKLLLYGLARLDPVLGEAMSRAGLQQAVAASITPSPEPLFLARGDEPPSGPAPSFGFTGRLMDPSSGEHYGYGFLVGDRLLLTSARHRDDLPSVVSVALLDAPQPVQAERLTLVTTGPAVDVVALRLLVPTSVVTVPAVGDAVQRTRYHAGLELSPGALSIGTGTVGAVTADSIQLLPDYELESAQLLDGTPIMVDGASVGIVVVDPSGAAKVRPLRSIAAEIEQWNAEISTAQSPVTSTTANADGESLEGFTPAAIDVLATANGLRASCDRNEIHLEHLVTALATVAGGSLQPLLATAGMTVEDLHQLAYGAAGLTVKPLESVDPISVPPMPNLSTHAQIALDSARRVATANGRGDVDEIHLAFGALSVAKCGVVAALADRDIHRNLLPLSFPARREIAVVRADTPDGEDLLGLEREVGALAAVLAARDVEPPLSVGLFGDWGSGKSFFMHQLEKAIDALSKQARDNPTDEMFCERVVQLTFNAWHYMDVDLWANLAAEIFQQLAADIDKQASGSNPDAGTTQRNRLLAAALHTRDVLAEAERSRDAVKAELASTQKLKGDLERKTSDLDTRLDSKKLLPAAVTNALADRDVQQQLSSTVERLGLTGAKLSVEEIQTRLLELRGVARQLWLMWQRWKASGATLKILTAVAIVVIGAGVPIAASMLTEATAALTRVIVSTASTIAAGLAVLSRYLTKIHDVTKKVDGIQQSQMQKQQEALRQERTATQRRLEAADLLVESKRNDLTDIEWQLEQMRADTRVRSFIDERSRSVDYSKNFGTVARARGDFERLVKLFAEVRDESLKSKSDAAKDGFPRIDRIVLYIDDLDRCPEDKVVAVLQAVHLLLAMPLFVVVVGVDSRWLLHSLRRHSGLFQDQSDGEQQNGDLVDDEERVHWQSTPLNYMEKIFQIPFTLRPMGELGYRRMVDELTKPAKVAHATAPPPSAASTTPATAGGQPTPTPATPSPASDPASTNATQPATPSPDATGVSPATPSGSTYVPTTPRSQFLRIEDWERRAMRQLFALIPSPRSAKRFVNVYRLLRATLTDEDYDGFVDRNTGDYQVVLLLLAMLIGHPAPTTEIIRDLLEAEKTETDFWTLVTGCLDDHRSTTGEPVSFSARVDAERWVALEAALNDVKGDFGSVGDVERAQRWARVVARYSFQSGRVLIDHTEEALT